MASTFKSFLNTARQTISGTATTGEIPAVNELFPKVDPAVDGDDCDHDCTSCVVKWPKGFKVEEDDELYGHVKGWSTHILVATGKADWVRDVADEKGSLMEAIEKKADVKISNGVSVTKHLHTETHVLTALIETHAFSIEYTHSKSFFRLRRANNSPASTCFHNYRKCHSQIRQHPYL